MKINEWEKREREKRLFSLDSIQFDVYGDDDDDVLFCFVNLQCSFFSNLLSLNFILFFLLFLSINLTQNHQITLIDNEKTKSSIKRNYLYK